MFRGARVQQAIRITRKVIVKFWNFKNIFRCTTVAVAKLLVRHRCTR